MEEQIKAIKQWLGTGSINIFGHPFAGKDTQAERLADFFDGHVISGGAILRGYPDQDKVRDIISRGELAPTDAYLEIVLPYLSKEEFAGKPLILSSVGRFHGEEKAILQATEQANHATKAVIQLTLDEDEVWRRFHQSQEDHDRGEREDDNEDVIGTRLKEFNEKTRPVLEFYRRNGYLIEIDGLKDRDTVTNEIIEKLAEKAT